ncbi:MAG: hypothetical protein K6F50_04415 [Kiritimatiellae bacterium]|nr:hypothetical protein [Kiritimatiellia bacterium]
MEQTDDTTARKTASRGGLHGWLRFFRAVNLPTVPGDVLAGAAAAIAFSADISPVCFRVAAWAAASSVFLYMFGLADNDVTGAGLDSGRPIPDGEITLAGARIARGFCLGAALVSAALGNLPPAWWISATALLASIAMYNRTKRPFFMGLCRGLDVMCGGAAVSAATRPLSACAALAAIWTVYFAAVTKYSEGEETDPSKREFVGVLIGSTIYLQLAALLVLTLLDGRIKPLLVTGAIMLILLRLAKRSMPKVSAS